MYRIGFGYDVHALVPERELWLGGIKIPHTLGLLGHSDADVLIHAICDAMLGAANLKDIGYHFPDTSSNFKNIDSKILLKECDRLIKEKGYTIVPVEVYFTNGRVKVLIALAKGKKLYDKRADIKAKDQKREAAREYKVKNLRT